MNSYSETCLCLLIGPGSVAFAVVTEDDLNLSAAFRQDAIAAAIALNCSNKYVIRRHGCQCFATLSITAFPVPPADGTQDSVLKRPWQRLHDCTGRQQHLCLRLRQSYSFDGMYGLSCWIILQEGIELLHHDGYLR